MKKLMSGLIWLLFSLTSLFPLGALISAFFGYTFGIKNTPAFAVITALLCVLVAVTHIITKSSYKSKITTALLFVATLFSLVNAVFYMFKCSEIVVAVSVLVSTVCCCFLLLRHINSVTLKRVLFAVSVLLSLPLCFVLFMLFLFGNIGRNTVIKTVTSPNETHYAQVISSDQGALGGDTVVNVYENSDIDLIFFTLKDKGERVYLGQWGEYESMKI